MTKEVYIRIKGQQIGGEEEPIIMTVPGTYHKMNGFHYIHYEERMEGSEEISKNTIKISSRRVVILKRGVQSSQMILDLGEKDQAVYNTAFGSLAFETDTNSIHIRESKEMIEVIMEYSLSSGGSSLSDNILTIYILAKNNHGI